jgi:hypothetical protein
MAEPAIQTHTLYAHYARQVKLADDNIKNYGKYVDLALDGTPSTNLPKYIENLKATISNPKTLASQINGFKEKLAGAEKRYADYKLKYEAALFDKPKYQAEMRKLESTNDTFSTPVDKQNDCLHILDAETCKALCDAKNPTQPAGTSTCTCTFSDKQNIELTGTQTDAVRIWNNGSRLNNLTINDNRAYNEAHRDAIQLIPPAMFDPAKKNPDGSPYRIGDQTAGAILDGATIENCTIHCPGGTLQGVFASDGLLRNIQVLNNTITTQGFHFITFNGLLSGSIGGNRLKSTGEYTPKIYLNPARIGGTMVDDGMLCILSFAGSNITYQPISRPAANPYTLANGTSGADAEFVDARHKIPDNYLKMAAGLKNFNHQAYLDDYSTLTFGAYKTQYPNDYKMLLTLLETRMAEYNPASPRQKDHVLGAASQEQLTQIYPLLGPALAAAKGSSLDSTRLPELQHTAIRGFVMKQIAIRHAEVEQLVDLGKLNARREAILKYMLPASAFVNLARQGRIDCQVIEVQSNGQQQPVVSQTFKLHFEGIAPIPGMTTPAGRILMDGLPLAPYILRFDDANLVTTTYTNS